MRLLATSLMGLLAFTASSVADVLTHLQMGDPQSEQQHRLESAFSEIKVGGLGQTARVLLPRDPVDDYGGHVEFDVDVDPERPNYITVKLFGSDAGIDRGRLLLFCEGKQVGIRHLGDVGPIDIASDAPRFPGRFTFVTTVLPKAMTAGKQRVRVGIRALGRIWSYGETWERFQKKLELPSRGIYAVYTHTDPFFVPPEGEVLGAAPAPLGPRTTPGIEVLDALKTRVSDEINKTLRAERIDQMRIQFLARAYHVKWTPAHDNPEAIDRVVRGLDELYLAYRANPELARNDPRTWNATWFGFGPAADAIRLLAPQLLPQLDLPVEGGDGITRRKAYADMLLTAREWHRMNRRLYTNQSMIKDLNGIYLANRGLQILAPEQAMPETEARRYLYESVGLQPWRGNDTPDGSSEFPVGRNYMQLTDKGLTRELGYVGSYGEVIDLVAAIYDATRDQPGQSGDQLIRDQLAKIANARAAFRHPSIDAEGFPVMRLQSVVGWRDDRFPGHIIYAQRATREAGPFEAAVLTQDPALLDYARQMIDEGQFASAMLETMRENTFRVTVGLLHTPDAFELINSRPAATRKLPMSDGQPDFVFADEENGVVAIRSGDDILYASLYWRARFAVNFLARVHHITPTVERDVTLWQDILYQDSGLTYTRDDRTIESQTRRHERSRGDLQQALAGETLPIAKIPDGVRFRPGDENLFAGRGDFYTLRYGPFLIAMNMSQANTYQLTLPLEPGGVATNLVSKTKVPLDGQSLPVPARSTVVLRLATP